MSGRRPASRPRQANETPKKPKLSRLPKPEGMSLEDWQIELRRQFGRMQKFRLRNVGDQALFAEFEVTNPQSQNTYRVKFRGASRGINHCSSPHVAMTT